MPLVIVDIVKKLFPCVENVGGAVMFRVALMGVSYLKLVENAAVVTIVETLEDNIVETLEDNIDENLEDNIAVILEDNIGVLAVDTLLEILEEHKIELCVANMDGLSLVVVEVVGKLIPCGEDEDGVVMSRVTLMAVSNLKLIDNFVVVTIVETLEDNIVETLEKKLFLKLEN